MIKTLSEKELGHAFFYSLKMGDFEHAHYLLRIGAPVNTSYFYSQGDLVYTISTIAFIKIWQLQELLKLSRSMAPPTQNHNYFSGF